VVVAGRARAVVIGVGSNTAMGSIRDAMLHTDDVCIFLLFCSMFFFCSLCDAVILLLKFCYS
jgi:magnesium-transporting ATPase (P-type)